MSSAEQISYTSTHSNLTFLSLYGEFVLQSNLSSNLLVFFFICPVSLMASYRQRDPFHSLLSNSQSIMYVLF